LKDNKSNRGTRLLLVGESGIGKSALLDEVYRRLIQGDDQRNRPFVGYYSKKESLLAESESLLYPFSIVLKSLINNAKESQQLGEKIDNTMARVKKGLLKFGKEQGIKIGVAIIEDVAKKAGLEQTLDVGKDILKAVGSEKTSLMLAQQYIADHRDEARQSYLEIFKAIADEFKERRFVLIFDQFENVGKASTDFFLNFVKFLMPQERFDIILSFKIDDTIWNDPSARKVYEDLERKLVYDLAAKKISMEGLSAQDIGKWIKQVRRISLPPTPDLQRIRENSAGLPFLLEQWIKSSNDLKDYDNIKRDKLCSQIIRLEKGLDKQDQDNLYKMSILFQPLKYNRLAAYLAMEEKEERKERQYLVRPFIKKLIENTIFDQRFKWFRHELVQRCFEDDLDNEERRSYHERAAEFFESLMEEKRNIQANGNTNIEEEGEESHSIAMSYAYHLHMAGGRYHEKSFHYNKDLAEYASKIGDLDVGERSFKRAIDDAKYLGRTQDEMDCLWNMTQKVYFVWGRYEEALSNYQSLLKHYDKANDLAIRARLLNNISDIHRNRGEYEKALKLYNESLEIAKRIDDKQGIAYSLNDIAIIYDRKGEYEKAVDLYNQSLEIARRIGYQPGIAYTLNNIADIHDRKGEYEKALKLYNESLGASRQRQDKQGIVYTLNNMALIHDRKGEYEKAVDLYNQSLEISRRIGYQQGIMYSLDKISDIHRNRGEYEKALKLYDENLEIARQLGDQRVIAYTLNDIAIIYDRKGEYEKAVDLYNQSLEISRRIGDQYMVGTTLNNMAVALINKEKYEESLFYVLQAYTILQRLDLPPELQRSLDILNNIEGKLGSDAYQRLVEKIEERQLS
jgi:tetratricopeptide (TPR) repeat protein